MVMWLSKKVFGFVIWTVRRNGVVSVKGLYDLQEKRYRTMKKAAIFNPVIWFFTTGSRDIHTDNQNVLKKAIEANLPNPFKISELGLMNMSVTVLVLINSIAGLIVFPSIILTIPVLLNVTLSWYIVYLYSFFVDTGKLLDDQEKATAKELIHMTHA